MKSVKNNLKNFFNDVRDRKTEKAVYQIMQEGLAIASTHTPVDTAMLINSQRSALKYTSPDKVSGVAGFYTNYAFFVHEKQGKLKGKERSNGRGYYWSPDADPKFLEKGFEELKPQIPKILKAIYEVE